MQSSVSLMATSQAVLINEMSVTCVSVLSSSKQGRGLVVVEVVVSVRMIGVVLHGGGRGGVGGRGGCGRVWLVKQH